MKTVTLRILPLQKSGVRRPERIPSDALAFHPDVAEVLAASGWTSAGRDAARVFFLPPDGQSRSARSARYVDAVLVTELPEREEIWRLANEIDGRGEASWQGKPWGWPAQYVRALDIYRHVTPFVFWIGGPRCPWRARLTWSDGAPAYETRAPGVIAGAAAWLASFR